jgi:hypothetical protein
MNADQKQNLSVFIGVHLRPDCFFHHPVNLEHAIDPASRNDWGGYDLTLSPPSGLSLE